MPTQAFIDDSQAARLSTDQSVFQSESADRIVGDGSSNSSNDRLGGATQPLARGWGSRRIRKTDLLIVTSQLAIMCESRIDLAQALRSVARECRQPELKARLEAIFQDVNTGSSAAAAMNRHADVLGDAYVASIAAAEASGTVTNVLHRLAEMLRNEIRLQGSLKAVLAYPVILVGVAGIVLTTLVFFVLPQFGQVFENLGRPAPATTQLLLDTAQFLRENVLLLLAGVGASAVMFWFYAKTDAAHRQRDSIILNSRLLRTGTRPLLTGRVFRLMGTMLQSGVPLLEAVRFCRASLKNHLMRDLFDQLEYDVLNGQALGRALSQASIIPPGAAQMVATAEKTGRLGPVLQTVGEFFEEEGERHVCQAVKILEPAIIVVMGVVVATVVLSVMLPLLDVSTMSR